MRVRVGEVRGDAFYDLGFSGAGRAGQDDVVAGEECGFDLFDNRLTKVTREVQPVKEIIGWERPGKRFLVIDWCEFCEIWC
ncbi:hypothetical protein [Halorubrum ezzemoulense]|uniref:hypothetical protein n=1 Tax=Halorubrum ezzemoulense TaxID=337243 RepID=UPI002330DBE0|nr:hypothetical protein [Halorubrum ezzemoulense]